MVTVAIRDDTFRVSGNSGSYIPGSGNSGCYIPGKWQFPMLHSGLWQFWMLLVAILDVTISSGVIMPRVPFGLSVLGQMQVLGKLYKTENPTCKIPCAI